MKTGPGIEVLLDETRVFMPKPAFSGGAHIKNKAEYEKMYKRSIEDPEGFWAEMAEKELTWFKKWDKVQDCDLEEPRIKWFEGGKLNASHNCLDRHLKTARKNKAAIIWEGNDGEVKTFTYRQLYLEVNRFANVLKKKGVSKGDRVVIYLPMVPELVVAMLACARIGAAHVVVFGGFSAQSLKSRILDTEAKLVVTADNGIRGTKIVPLKKIVDEAVCDCGSVASVIVVKRTGDCDLIKGRDSYYHDEIESPDISGYCEPKAMDADDLLYILHTSGSTGKPKGIMHSTGGYLLHVAMTFKYIFNCKEEDTHFCTADIGWLTGHSYSVYGPLAMGATSLIYEGVPNYPNPGRLWDIVEKHSVNTFFTAPTVIRSLIKEGESWVKRHDLSSLKLIGSTGEQLGPETFIWFYENVGKGKLPLIDGFGLTETGGLIITPLPGSMALKPGSVNKPFFGVDTEVVREDGSSARPGEGGYLVINKALPGMLKGIYGDHDNERLKEIYFSKFPGRYFTGDGVRTDKDGDYWLMGRIDDVLNVSGHRIGVAEIESALVSHPMVAEAAVIGYPHSIKGEAIYAYVTLQDGVRPSPEAKKELISHVREVIGPIATPDTIRFSPTLPKTRSGKIMRRILRSIACGEIDEIGDISTLSNPGIVKELIDNKQ